MTEEENGVDRKSGWILATDNKIKLRKNVIDEFGLTWRDLLREYKKKHPLDKKCEGIKRIVPRRTYKEVETKSGKGVEWETFRAIAICIEKYISLPNGFTFGELADNLSGIPDTHLANCPISEANKVVKSPEIRKPLRFFSKSKFILGAVATIAILFVSTMAIIALMTPTTKTKKVLIQEQLPDSTQDLIELTIEFRQDGTANLLKSEGALLGFELRSHAQSGQSLFCPTDYTFAPPLHFKTNIPIESLKNQQALTVWKKQNSPLHKLIDWANQIAETPTQDGIKELRQDMAQVKETVYDLGFKNSDDITQLFFDEVASTDPSPQQEYWFDDLNVPVHRVTSWWSEDIFFQPHAEGYHHAAKIAEVMKHRKALDLYVYAIKHAKSEPYHNDAKLAFDFCQFVQAIDRNLVLQHRDTLLFALNRLKQEFSDEDNADTRRLLTLNVYLVMFDVFHDAKQLNLNSDELPRIFEQGVALAKRAKPSHQRQIFIANSLNYLSLVAKTPSEKANLLKELLPLIEQVASTLESQQQYYEAAQAFQNVSANMQLESNLVSHQARIEVTKRALKNAVLSKNRLLISYLRLVLLKRQCVKYQYFSRRLTHDDYTQLHKLTVEIAKEKQVFLKLSDDFHKNWIADCDHILVLQILGGCAKFVETGRDARIDVRLIRDKAFEKAWNEFRMLHKFGTENKVSSLDLAKLTADSCNIFLNRMSKQTVSGFEQKLIITTLIESMLVLEKFKEIERLDNSWRISVQILGRVARTNIKTEGYVLNAMGAVVRYAELGAIDKESLSVFMADLNDIKKYLKRYK